MNAHTAASNHLVEITFLSGKPYPDPFFEVTLDVCFTEPGGGLRTVPAFWAGGCRWVVRYASALVGEHAYTTHCSDTTNPDLHAKKGSLTVTPCAGNNPLFRHGAPKLAADKRHFAHADGAPFFWLGDTWWLGLTKRLGWPDDFQALAKDRQSKGFTVVQIVAGLYPDMAAFDARGESLSGFSWEAGFTSINPAFFDEADARIMHLVEAGLCPCILGGWGYYLQAMGAAKMKLHWRYIMARWGALPVVFAAAGEQVMPWYLSESRESDSAWLKQAWTEVIRGMREINAFDRLITTHPQTDCRSCVDDPSLLDFEMQQTGHGTPTARQAALALQAWHTQPIMPVVCGESRYEALEISPQVTAADARQAFWAHMLNSGCAGHTYGANGVWQVNLDNQPFGNSPNGHNWGTTPWKQAVHLPGASQLGHAKNLLINLPWHRLEPLALPAMGAWRRLLNAALLRATPQQHAAAAAATPEGDLTLCYLLGPASLVVDGRRFSGSVDAAWFDPTSGGLTPITGMESLLSGCMVFTPPGHNSTGESDWLLVIRCVALAP